MANQQIAFKAWCSGSAKADLDGIVNLNNESTFSDETVAEGLRGFLAAYAIGYTPQGGELTAHCSYAHGGRRQVSIFAPKEGNIWMVATNKNAPRILCEKYHFVTMTTPTVHITSADADYSVNIGRG